MNKIKIMKQTEIYIDESMKNMLCILKYVYEYQKVQTFVRFNQRKNKT